MKPIKIGVTCPACLTTIEEHETLKTDFCATEMFVQEAFCPSCANRLYIPYVTTKQFYVPEAFLYEEITFENLLKKYNPLGDHDDIVHYYAPHRLELASIEKMMEASPFFELKEGRWRCDIMSKGARSNFLLKRAHVSWRMQGCRCTKKTDKSYTYYGARGVKRVWTLQECCDFYVNELLTRPSWVSPVISRKEDKGNYELGNVELLERTENAALTPR